MTNLWDGQANDSKQGDSELHLIPTWSILLAIVVFCVTQYVFHGVLPHHRGELLPWRIFAGFSSGAALSTYILLIGYVSGDVKRRNMSAPLWLLLVILMPGGIGAVVYFLLRQPILSRCPHCNTEIPSSYHFCPQCQFQIAPVCGQCYRGVQTTDVYCTQCGHDLAEDHSPARLRAYSD